MSEDDDNAGNRALRGWRKPRAIFAFVGRLNQCSATIKMDGRIASSGNAPEWVEHCLRGVGGGFACCWWVLWGGGERRGGRGEGGGGGVWRGVNLSSGV